MFAWPLHSWTLHPDGDGLKMTTKPLKDALSLLETHEPNEPIQKLFGSIIRKRLFGPNPDCRLIGTLISDERNMLPRWRVDFGDYIKAIGDSDLAQRKVEADLLGRAERCSPSEFDNYWGDFSAEISAVNELARVKRFKQFVPIVPPQDKTYDYDALAEETMVAIEVKNARAPITITDAFVAALRKRPEFLRVRVALTYYWDNTVTPEQNHQIESFVSELATRRAGYIGNLLLEPNINVRVSVLEGKGNVVMTRGMGGTCPDVELKVEGLFKRISEKTQSAVRQLSTAQGRRKILVINIDTPGGMIDESVALAVKATVTEESSGQLECFLLHHHSFLNI